MSKKRNKKGKKGQKHRKLKTNLPKLDVDPAITSPLEVLYKQRHGGPAAIRGFLFQANYSFLKILEVFAKRSTSKDVITLEGFEDLDYTPELERVRIKTTCLGSSEHIQVKYSSKSMNASTFWDKEILQHFAKLFVINPDSQFILIVNKPFKKGNLHRFKELCAGIADLSDEKSKYWKAKLDKFVNEQKVKSGEEIWRNFNIQKFITGITVVVLQEAEIFKKIRTILAEDFNIIGNEMLYINSVGFSILNWCKERKDISSSLLHETINSVKQAIGKGDVIPAIKYRWIDRVLFDERTILEESRDVFFSGKAARPEHIIAGYPIERKEWKELILQKLETNNAVLIRASSGQGKSTLAWQVAMEKERAGVAIFELHWSRDKEKVGSIVDVLESNIKAGKVPLLVIDGLHSELASWDEIVSRTAHLPVKFIITSREEDWHRYGADISHFKLEPVDIFLSQSEAKEVFNRLKQENRVNDSVTSWESAWEKMGDRGLLLEYTYLLTFGTMIKERIAGQVKTLSDERDGKSKLELLRLISCADLCEVRIGADNLLSYIENTIGFHGDRGRVLQSLHKEYHIFIREGHLVEGLHPVRSQHLFDELHAMGVAEFETATKLFHVIDPKYFSSLVRNGLSFIPSQEDRKRYLDEIANLISDSSFEEKNSFLSGLLSFEALEHMAVNKGKYDILAQKQVLELSFIELSPWTKVGLLKNLLSQAENQSNLNQIYDHISDIEKFDPHYSYTRYFLQKMQSSDLPGISPLTSIGLGTYLSWCFAFIPEANLLSGINYEEFKTLALNLTALESSSIATALFSANSAKYLNLIKGHEAEIISILKEKTNTLSVYEDGFDLILEYCTVEGGSAGLNEESVERIGFFSAFLPGYNRYCTQGIYTPIPGLDVILEQYDESKKHMPVENIPTPFLQKLNNIWRSECKKPYEFATCFEWQSKIFSIRKCGIVLVENLNLFLEYHLESDNRRSNLINKITQTQSEIQEHFNTKGISPDNWRSSKDSTIVKEEVKKVDAWITNLQDVNHQIINLFNENENFKRIFLSSIRKVCHSLSSMQDAFKSIVDLSGHNFDIETLERKETSCYRKLFMVATYFVQNGNKFGAVLNARSTVQDYFKNEESQRIRFLGQVLDKICNEFNLVTYLPNSTVLAGDNLRSIAFGIEGNVDFSNPDLLIKVLFLLSEQDKLGIDFFYLVLVEEGVAKMMFRISKILLNEISEIVDGKLENATSFVLPVDIDKHIVDTLPGVKMSNLHGNENCTQQFLEYVWYLSESRKRLDFSSSRERLFYDRIFQKYSQLRREVNNEELVYRVDKLLENEGIISVNDFQDLFFTSTP